MKIQRIHLTNFGPYADAQLELDGPVAIAGDNGAGKSMIIDALTWALWGEARSRDHSKLVRLGADVGAVELELQARGQRYRISRTRRVTGRGTTKLHLERHNGEEWVSEAGANARDTQARIVAALGGLTYELACNTTLAVQGGSATLSEATPGERRKVLHSLVGADRFEALRVLVLTKVAKGNAFASIIESSAEDLRAGVPLSEAQAAHASAQAAAAEATRNSEASAELYQRAIKESAQAEAALAAEESRATARDAERLRLDEAERRAQAAREKLEILQETAGTSRNTDVEGMRARVDRAQADMDAASRASQAIAEEIGRLAADRGALVDKARADERMAADAMAVARQLVTARQLKAGDEWREIKHVRADAERALAAAKEDAATLHGVPCAGVGEYTVCRFLSRAIEQRDSVPALEAALEAAEKKHGEAAEALDVAYAAEPALPPEAEQARARVAEAAEKVAAIDEQADDAAKRLQAARREEERAADALRLARMVLRDAENTRDAVEKARLAEAEAKASYEAVQAEAMRLREAFDALPVANVGLAMDAVRAARAAQDEARTASAEAAAVESKARELAALAAAEQRAAEQRAADLAAKQAELAATRATVADLQTLDRALVDAPTIILESVIPEVESEANRYLARMAVTGLQVRLDTQRGAKSGDHVIETLDIIVTDEAGERPYELYSGGERFRVDLALRMALGSVLMTRRGAPLETLVVDEGFGSLDAQGREAVPQVLAELATQYGSAIVVSHVQEIVAAFGRRAVVRKRGDGSTIETEG